MKKFNINHDAKIKLTNRGKEILALYREHLQSLYHKIDVSHFIPDEYDYITLQLVEVMEIFGPFLTLDSINSLFDYNFELSDGGFAYAD